jgi:hypothetical protein
VLKGLFAAGLSRSGCWRDDRGGSHLQTSVHPMRGVNGTTLAWISSFLSSRKQLVLLDGVKSSEKEVLSGVPTSTCPLDMRFWAIFCIVVTSWVSQERLLLNSCCLSVRMLFRSKWLGPDCIPSFILKSAADELAPILTQLYQYSLAEGEISSDWRDAHIVPVFKLQTHILDIDGYLLCPISGIVLVFSFVYTDWNCSLSISALDVVSLCIKPSLRPERFWIPSC